MATLKQLQADMMEALFDKEPKTHWIKACGAKTPLDDITVYRNSAQGNTFEAFKEVYPVVHKLVGESYFAHLFRQFYQAFPHLHYDLGDYGEDFPSWCLSIESLKDYPYIPQVGQLEWAVHRSVNGPSYTNRLEPLALGQLNEEQMAHVVFERVPQSTVIESDYPILAIFESNQDDFTGDHQINLDEPGDKLFVWRHGLDLRIERLGDDECLFLKRVSEGHGMGELLTRLSQDDSVSLEQCQKVLAKAIQKGWLVGFNVLQ